MITKIKNLKLAVIGLGYVGLPLALEFAKKREVIGFDIQENRIKDLKSGIDKNLEVTKEELIKGKHLTFTKTLKTSVVLLLMCQPLLMNIKNLT